MDGQSASDRLRFNAGLQPQGTPLLRPGIEILLGYFSQQRADAPSRKALSALSPGFGLAALTEQLGVTI